MVNTLIFIALVLIIYYSINYIRSIGENEQRKKDPINSENHKKYLEKKTLFSLYSNYIYNNIEEFRNINDYTKLQEKLELDYPNYGEGIYRDGILTDFIECDLLKRNTRKNNFTFGLTFEIISISYPNFKVFCGEIYNSEYKMKHYRGGYHSEFGDDIIQRIIYVEINNSKAFIGISKGGGNNENMKEYKLRHNIEFDNEEMYLFFEFQINTGPSVAHPYFYYLKLRKDMPVKEYHSFFNSNLEKCKHMA